MWCDTKTEETGCFQSGLKAVCMHMLFCISMFKNIVQSWSVLRHAMCPGLCWEFLSPDLHFAPTIIEFLDTMERLHNRYTAL